METLATILKHDDPRKSVDVEAVCVEFGEPVFDCSKPDKALNIEDAWTFLLASLDRATAAIKITGLTAGNSSRRVLTQEEIRQQIITLLKNKARGTAGNDAGVFLRELFEVSMAENDYQKETIMRQTGCRVSLQANIRDTQLELRAWPDIYSETRNVDILTNDMPMRFVVEGYSLLISDELSTHPILGQHTEN